MRGEGIGKGTRERESNKGQRGWWNLARDLNNTLHLNASTDKRNGPATRDILLRAIIFSLANATVVVVLLSKISCNSLSLFARRRAWILFVSCFKWFFRNEVFSLSSSSSFFPLSLSFCLSSSSNPFRGQTRRFTVRGRIYERSDAVVAFFRILVAREYIRNGIKMEMFPAGTSPYSSRISATSP